MKATPANKRFPKSMQDAVRYTQGHIACLRAARVYVPFVLAHCLLDDSNADRTGIVTAFAEQLGDLPTAMKKRDQLFIRLRALIEQDGTKKLLGDAEDLYWDFAINFGEAAYLIGLAVGQQLGPDAFTGGAR